VSVSPQEIEAIVRGEHGDPFAVLGPHAVGSARRTAIAVRAFLPGAITVTVKPLTPTPRPRSSPGCWAGSVAA